MIVSVEPAIYVSTFGVLVTLVLGLLTWQRGLKTDKSSAEATKASESAQATQIAFTAYAALIEDLQKQGEVHDRKLHECESRCEKCEEHLREQRHEVRGLKVDLAVAQRMIEIQAQEIERLRQRSV